MAYPVRPERIFALHGLDAAQRRTRERLCASNRGEFAWLRLDTCVERVLPRHEADVPRLISSQAVSLFLHKALPFAGRGSEHAMVVCLDPRMQPMGVALVGSGGRSSLGIDTVLLLQPPVLVGASAFIFAHNHPSGDPTPSREDAELTQKLKAAGKLLALDLLDHLVLTDSPLVFYSFQDHGQMI